MLEIKLKPIYYSTISGQASDKAAAYRYLTPLTSEPKADNFYMFMTAIIIVSLVFLLGLALGAAVIWYVLRRQQTARVKEPANEKAATSLTFHWKYILLPMAILLISIILALIFYPQLTDEVAYRFNPDGSAKSWLSREIFTLFMLVAQFLLALTASAITWGVTKLSLQFGQVERIKPGNILLLMGNIIALPQIVLAFVMLDIFSYNIYDSHLMPIWLFALIIMVIGGIILTIFFIRTIKASRSISR